MEKVSRKTPVHNNHFFFFFLGKKVILLIEKKKRYTEFTIVNKEQHRKQKEIKESTTYSKRQKKINKSRRIRKTPTPRPMEESLLAQI